MVERTLCVNQTLLCNFIPIFRSFLWVCVLLCAVSHGETIFREEKTLYSKASLMKQRALVANTWEATCQLLWNKLNSLGRAPGKNYKVQRPC